MSASGVSITANPASASTRRRAVEKRRPAALDVPESNLAAAASAAASPSATAGGGDPTPTGKDLSHHSVRSETRDAILVVKKPLPNSDGSVPVPTARRASTTKKASKPVKPRWLTVFSVVTKNFLLLLVLAGLAQIVRRLIVNSNHGGNADGLAVVSEDFEGKFAEMESFVKKTTKMMQVQIEVIDRKLDTEIKGVKDEVSVKLEEKGAELESKLKEVGGRTENLEKLISELGDKNWVSRDELDNFLEEFKKTKGGDFDDSILDQVRVYARGIVEKEIEKHAADGLGRVDYALGSGGAMVVRHSEPFIVKAGSASWSLLTNRNMVCADAQKMLTPSFGEPGQCFPLKGSSGFVHIRLRTAIIPEAVTLEHVAKSVAYDRSSAPKHGRISGWLQGNKGIDLTADNEKMFLLTEFTYDLKKSNAQTFNILDSANSGIVDTIRFDFTSNHGAPHTCIYRLRVHGREPNSLAMQS